MMLAAPADSHAAKTRERLLDAAEHLFAERGFGGASVRDITAAAGCNVAAINYHFGGKENLYQETFRRRAELMREPRLESIRQAVAHPRSATLESVLRSFADAFVGVFLKVHALDSLLKEALARLIVRARIMPRLLVNVFLPYWDMRYASDLMAKL